MEFVYFMVFHTVSVIHSETGRHSEIKLSTVNKIIKEWEYYKDIIADLSIVNSAEDQKIYFLEIVTLFGIFVKFVWLFFGLKLFLDKIGLK